MNKFEKFLITYCALSVFISVLLLAFASLFRFNESEFYGPISIMIMVQGFLFPGIIELLYLIWFKKDKK